MKRVSGERVLGLQGRSVGTVEVSADRMVSIGWAVGRSHPTAEPRQGAASSMALIMIVDDDAHIQLALRQIVESAGHSAIEAGNGQEAIGMFGEYRPDLVITDVFMPQTDGIETIRANRHVQ